MATHGQALETEYQNASKNHEACFKISDSICQEKSLWLEMEKKKDVFYIIFGQNLIIPAIVAWPTNIE